MLRAVIIDDEEHGIETLKIHASRNPALIKVIGSALKAEEGICMIEDYKPDIVFLDISMPGMNGFELLSKLDFRDFKLVFTTAHKEFAIEAIKNRAFDYLLKPIDGGALKKCVEEICNEQKVRLAAIAPDQQPLIEMQVKDGIVYIKQKDIIRLEASRSYTCIYLDNGIRHVASRTLREFETRLDPEIFYRCHKSHVINLQKVQKFINHEGFFALMCDGSMPDISKNNKDEFLGRLKSI